MADVIKIKHRRPVKINMALAILVVVVAYVVICFIIFLTKKKVTMYEVSAGTIMRDDIYKGYIIREEHVVNAAYSGSLNYFVYEKERVENKANICSIDNSGLVSKYIDTLKAQTNYFNEDALKSINSVVSSYKLSHDGKRFNNFYEFENNLDNTITNCLSENILEHLNSYALDNENSINIMTTDKTGVIICGYDGLEGSKEEDLKYSDFSNDRSYVSFLGKKNVEIGEPVYKIITSEEWYIYIKLNDEQVSRYQNEGVISLKFIDSNITTNANFSIYTNQYGVYGKIYLNRYMMDFANDRYVNLEIIDNREEGLKIPKESVIQKDFFKVPKTAVAKRSDDEYGILIPDGDSSTFKKIEIFDSDDEFYYIDKGKIKTGSHIVDGEQGKDYVLSETKKLSGVYRINKGFAVFRRIEIIDENDDFYIVKKNTPYGISIYDHIIQNCDNVVEGEILY